MSTETVYYSKAREIKAAELRRREAAAREARRRAAQLKAEQKAQEAARRRIDAANVIIQDQEHIFQYEIARLDEATQRLPDLLMSAPELSTPEYSNNTAPEEVEVYAAMMTNEVSRFVEQLGTAIVDAERLLQRRLQKAEAWRNAMDLENNVKCRKQDVDGLAALLQLVPKEITLPVRPDSSAELEEVQMYLEAIKQSMDEMEQEYSNLISRQQSRERAAGLAGSQLRVNNVGKAQKEHQSSLLVSAKNSLIKMLDQTLDTYEMRLKDLPEATQWLVEDAISHADTSDKSEQVVRWIARTKQHLEGTRKSIIMMQEAPEMIHKNKQLSYRWSLLVERLQRVAGGLDEFTPDLDREYQQISVDAGRNICTAYTKEDWLCAMSEQGFEVFERENGEGMVVVDLNNLDVWLEAAEIQSNGGDGFGVSMELKTDVNSSPEQEIAITENVCSRLKQAMSATTDETNVHSEVVSRTQKITRGKRLTRKLKTFHQPLR